MKNACRIIENFTGSNEKVSQSSTIRKVESLSQENSPEINSIINQDSPD